MGKNKEIIPIGKISSEDTKKIRIRTKLSVDYRNITLEP